MKYAKQVLTFGLAAVFAAILSVGCETTEGAGEDIQDAGEAIEDAAN